MNRRDFLFGTISSAAGGLLLRAQADAVEIFRPTLAETVAISRVSRFPDAFDGADWPIRPGETLFNSRGKPVVVVQRLHITRTLEDASAANEAFGFAVAGPIRFQIEGDGIV